ncbi:BFH_HP2_G0046950.mRNA.1.CDS.1 [Saccharomyces cerevisiae]|nr:BFH_HP2_G0046950.mRNA.1.CDS.1 [Saccharomyces cerevisiae]CAI6750953.1 BFH_HP2_G0046950.mRNA.1.CDS.1 [Saccharomyces cerevisiae]
MSTKTPGETLVLCGVFLIGYIILKAILLNSKILSKGVVMLWFSKKAQILVFNELSRGGEKR